MRAYERLIEYTKFHTGSFEGAEEFPSSREQYTFGEYLVQELRENGVEASIDENGYVIGRLPANDGRENGKTLAFIAHMDTVSDVEYRNVKPKITKNYDGGSIILNEEENVTMCPEEYPFLEDYIGQDILTTDGKTILGADDKAGIAEIMTFFERLNNDKSIKHGDIAVCFTPDEEIGRGTDKLDLEKLSADFGYTLDGGKFGQIEYENFNAINVKVTFKGKSVHPGSAKQGRMKNATRLAIEFDGMIPQNERPEHTEGYEGFYHLLSINGSVEKTQCEYILRDHSKTGIKIRRAMLEEIESFLNKKYGKGSVVCEFFEMYSNMKEYLKNDMHLIENAISAIEKAGGTPEISAIRGGTDGARLSEMGMPCPNLGTGSENHHGRFEFAGIQDMDRAVEMLINIASLY